jgi:hypothetical protein
MRPHLIDGDGPFRMIHRKSKPNELSGTHSNCRDDNEAHQDGNMKSFERLHLQLLAI